MRSRKAAAYLGGCVLAVAVAQTAHAERWVQTGGADLRFWYDADSVRLTTTDRLIGVWVSAGPNRVNPGPNGTTVYPTYSIINCRERTAGSKISLDLGQALQSFAPNSGMGELIAKLCA
jgi:hypothetical protein